MFFFNALSQDIRCAQNEFFQIQYINLNHNMKSIICFYQQVEQLDEDGVHVSFMKESGQYFIFPAQEDHSFIFFSEIIEILPVPTIDGRNRHLFP